MSRERKDLDNSKEAIKKYVDYLYGSQFVKDVYIKGSRSPLTKKEPIATSDWDIEVVYLGNKRLVLTDPRKLFKIHADVHTVLKPSAKSILAKEIL